MSYRKKITLLLLLSSVFTTHLTFASNTPTFGKTFFRQRSQGSNLARWMAGQSQLIHLCNTDCMNGSLALIPNYFQSYNEKEIGEYFGFNGSNVLRFGQAAQQNVDVFSRNFFLNDQFEGIVSFEPIVRNFVFDINLFLGFDEWIRGLWFRVDVPINWTSWDMRLTETITTNGQNIAAGALGNMMALPAPRNSIIQAWNGKILDPNQFPAIQQEMRFARIDGKQTKTGVADITIVLGYDAICNECAHLGFDFRVIVPTGTRPDGEFVFEPIVGNGRSFEVGAGLTGHYELWDNGCDQSFGVYFNSFAMHMFRAKQKRTFDLINNGIGSRYLLLKRFDTDGTFTGEVVFGPNVLTRDVKVRNDVHGEVVLMFDYQNGGFTFDIGYNLWGVTRDKLTITDNIPPSTFGVQGNTSTLMGAGTFNNTQSLTDIKGNFLPVVPDQVFISTSDLNVDSAAHPGALSHSLFTHLGYTWENCDYLPFLGFGGSVEFSGRNNRALDQWGIWGKGGFTFS